MKRRPLVAVVGRPNVGKSTLFNRLIGERRAVVHEEPGMTRDRHYGDAIYRGRPFTVIDTGGYEDSTDSSLLQQMRQQSLIAVEESDRVIFLTDVAQPSDPIDQEILEKLRASGRPFFLAVNKCDNHRAEMQAVADFAAFGVDAVFPVSSLHGAGVYDLLDEVTEGFEEWDPDEEEEADPSIRVAIVGRQNAGKSTLLNKLVGEERSIANPMAGTTRDAIDAAVEIDGTPYTIIDTAGIRRRGKIERGPEKLSVHSSFRAIERAEVALLVIDATEGVTAQDQHIAGYILERRRACIILLNKWDLVPNREESYGTMIRKLREEFNFMPWAPIVTISALTGQRTHRIWDLVKNCAVNFRKEFTTSQLNEVLARATAYLTPPTMKGNTLTIKYVVQTGSRPPTLTFFVNEPKYVHFSYERFLTNQFYRQLGLEGTPLVMRFRRKAPPRGWERHVRQMHQRGFRPMRPTEALADEDFIAGVYTEEDPHGGPLEIDLGADDE